MDRHNELLKVLIKFAKKSHNKNFLGIALEALKDAESDKDGIVSGINRCFCGSLRDSLLFSIGTNPNEVTKTNSLTR